MNSEALPRTGSRWRPPSRSRLVAGATLLRRTVRARLSRDSREARRTARKTKRNFAFSRPSSDPIRATPRPTRRPKERRRRSLSPGSPPIALGFQREVRYRRMATRNAAKGARRRSSLRPARRTARMTSAARSTSTDARVLSRFQCLFRVSRVFFGPWLCACVWHESMLLSCVCVRRVTVASGRGTTKAFGGGLAKARVGGFRRFFSCGASPSRTTSRPIRLFLRVFVLPDLSASSLEASSSSSSSLAVSPAISSRFSPAWISDAPRRPPGPRIHPRSPPRRSRRHAIAPAVLPGQRHACSRRETYGGHETLARFCAGGRSPTRGPRHRIGEILAASRSARPRPAIARNAGDAPRAGARPARARRDLPRPLARTISERTPRATDTRSWPRDAEQVGGRGARVLGGAQDRKGQPP